MEASIDCFEKAISLDSSYASAYGGLAAAWFSPCLEGFDCALEYTHTALELSPDYAKAHVESHYWVVQNLSAWLYYLDLGFRIIYFARFLIILILICYAMSLNF